MVLSPEKTTEKTSLLAGLWGKGKNSDSAPVNPPPHYGGTAPDSVESELVCSGEHGRAQKGLGIMLTSFFLVAQVAGVGVLALPWAIAQTGWGGLALLIGLGVCVGVCGVHLGTCWVILEERWPEYQRACRKPYPAMALRTLGKAGWYIVNVVQCVTLFGVSIVTILLSAEIVESVLNPLLPNVTVCTWLVVCGAVLVPLSWLGTPKEFWHVSVLALVAAVAAVVVVVIKILLEPLGEGTLHSAPTTQSFFLGFGAIMFSFGGAVVFPTIQNDMSDRTKFPHAIVVSFCALLVLYLPVAALGYMQFGTDVDTNILLMVHGPTVTVVEVLMLLNNLFTYVLIMNPLSQSLEEAVNLPTRFGWRRCLLRTSLVVVGVLVGLAVKNFGRILNLIGSFSVPFLTFVLPPIFYIRLCDSKENGNWPKRNLTPLHRAMLCLLVVVGSSCSLVATWTSLEALLAPSDSALNCFEV
ncbi:amino acid transporter AVT1B-like [Portunus trituberculatus]|uniref:amino acid transporter AVT1B-like n=1 Tax=Portunus trituberculatus TaxID=210409 RepID=UPI001E1CCA83|nr:amino acid transporter AVT1B-like [Portunus trituberculatus]XP_045138357.1 amino acid transporter AVT1B-like [Portunus trituberculatus]XP_045138358.1 amino acid transporter AVT1B-like [Portunus trituberculatus]XP_045138359.1 amino acid transporter AVT1B-like [Portunus trituberculatus]XP_045138360.1 amino acid transporter AVT1B-like [Portunus trituberculatus]XP_045138361.1 amino acid transporter AVT1B-like [Portunus trituberculatus]